MSVAPPLSKVWQTLHSANSASPCLGSAVAISARISPPGRLAGGGRLRDRRGGRLGQRRRTVALLAQEQDHVGPLLGSGRGNSAILVPGANALGFSIM